ncbi:transcription factor betaFTZ-F1 [Danaus plexippus plexippus]|uniref:Transcription factor betaFTZ-F1 n=1 Tax=Danaus plexippus plexippus TaxID=278856 RepID=A0A212EGK7_DANPL|nr:transcription factor betaFTZ-F1 [Danaus plexippus plexippus]
MSVTQGLNASMSQPKSDMVLEGTVEYEMTSTEAKPSENIQMDLKIAYADPLNGHEASGNVLLILIFKADKCWLYNNYIALWRLEVEATCSVHSVARCGNVALAFRAILQ